MRDYTEEDTAQPPPELGALPGEILAAKVQGSDEARGQLFGALAKAQGKLTEAKRASRHQTFGNYAEMQDYLAVIRPAFSAHGLGLVHFVLDGPEPDSYIYLETILGHEGGACIRSTSRAPIMPVGKASNRLQERGKAISYERRFTTAASSGMSSTDDNGGTAEPEQPQAAFDAKDKATLDKAAAEGPKAFSDAYKAVKAQGGAAFEAAWRANKEQVAEWKRTSEAVALAKTEKDGAA